MVNLLTAFAESTIDKGSEIRTDGLSIYSSLSGDGYVLKQKKYDPKNERSCTTKSDCAIIS